MNLTSIQHTQTKPTRLKTKNPVLCILTGEATPSTEVSEESVVPAAAEEVQVPVVAEEKEEGEIVDDAAEAQPEVEVVLAAAGAAAAAEAAEQETKPEAVVAVESKEEVPGELQLLSIFTGFLSTCYVLMTLFANVCDSAHSQHNA